MNAAVVVVAMVSVVVAAVPPEGVTFVGEKLHDAPVGRPEQTKVTVESNPPDGVIVIVVVALLPAITVADEGLTAMEKVDEGMRYVALPTALVEYGEATAIACSSSDDETVSGVVNCCVPVVNGVVPSVV